MEKINKYKIGKKYVRGDYEGRRFVEVVKFIKSKDIHSFLWDMTELYDKSRCNFVVEWYRKL